MKRNKHYLILLLATLIAFGNTLNHGFVLDDQAIISNHIHVQNGLDGISELMTTNYLHGVQEFNDGLYRPLTPVLFAIQTEFWPNSSFPGHLLNLLYVLLTACVIYHLLIQVFKSSKDFALGLTVLFLVLPIHTEVVANIKSSDELLALFFVLSSLIYWGKYLKTQNIKDLLIGSILFFIGLFSKESTFAFVGIIPVVLFLNFPTQRKSLIHVTGILAVLGGIFLWIRKSVLDSMPNPVDEGSLSALNNSILSTDVFIEKIGTAFWLQILYITKAIVPYSLQHDYSFNEIPVVSLVSIPGMLGLLFLLSLAYFAWKYWKTAPLITSGITWYFGSLLIVSNIFFPIGATFAERFLYAPSFGLVLVFLGVVTQLKPMDIRLAKTPLWVGMMVCTLVYLGVTINRNADWKDNYTLFAADYSKLQQSARGNYNYGSGCQEKLEETKNIRKRNTLLTEAITAFNQAITIYPDYWDAYNNLGMAYNSQKNYAKASEVYTNLTLKNPGYSKAYYNLGLNSFLIQDYLTCKKAFEHYNTFHNQNPTSWYLIGMSYGHLGDFEQAIHFLNQCIALQENHVDALLMLGKAYGIQQDYVKAEYFLRKVLQFSPNHPEAMQSLNATLAFKNASNPS